MPAIACFAGLLAATAAAASASAAGLTHLAHALLPAHGTLAGPLAPLLPAIACIVLFYAYALLLHRLLLHALPLRSGPVESSVRAAFGYQLYLLFYLMVFNALIRSRVLPIPLMRPVYLALGARLGARTHTGGTILDPAFVTIGHDTLIGEAALLVPHVLEGGTPAHFPIVIGNHVTIGTHAVLLAGVTVGDHALVAAHALVAKGTVIGPGEVWGGVPARRLRGARADLLQRGQTA
ncbi:transferase family hexapeptide repeat protein [Pseudoduganella lurida]|uniref:Transferase family hexapeptide repeat protein n=2 Tax=Pseudoduganella lurida TaxID=1036180 RepID=A0A562QZD5_9BURK|nr:transferase family hexapeptide repeat protein [Pseudoduganella lurida]